MTRVRVFIVFVLAIAAGGVFAYGTYNYVQKLPVKTVAMPTKPVIVASNPGRSRATTCKSHRPG